MASTLPVGHWSWHERWLFPDQLHDKPGMTPSRRTTGLQAQLHAAGLAAQQQRAARMAQREGALHTQVRGRTTGQQQPQQQQQHQRQQQPQQQRDVGRPQPRPQSGTQSSRLHGERSYRPTQRLPSSRPSTAKAQRHASRAPPSSSDDIDEESHPVAASIPVRAPPPGQSYPLSVALSSSPRDIPASSYDPLASSDDDLAESPQGLAPHNPHQPHTDAHAQARMHAWSDPSVPRRYRDGTFARLTSEYAHTYRHPVLIDHEERTGRPMSAAAASPASDRPHLIPGTRPPPRRGPQGESLAASPHRLRPVRPEQHSFLLWGRINTAHCVTRFQTESQRAFAVEGLEGAEEPDCAHHLRVEGKEFREAFEKARGQEMIRTGGK